jgi:2',3'-cyclic-nucleotide 2'-phosphodiesterase/3'-nucleotidase
LGARVGDSADHLHSYFARIFPSNIVSLVASAQTDHVRCALAGTAWERLPLLSAAAPFRAGGRGEASHFTDIAPGRLNLRHIADIYPFPNSIVALLLTGREVMDWLERAVIQFGTLAPGGAERALVQDTSPSFDFDLIDDLSFRIDLTQPPRFDHYGTVLEDRRRIKDLAYRGRRILAGDNFVLATNSFRSAGSGGFAGCRADRVILDDRTPSRTVLSAFLSAGAWNGRNGAFDWGLDSVGCSVTFDSAEKSLFHLDEIAPLHPTPVAGAAPGFQRFRLWV